MKPSIRKTVTFIEITYIEGGRAPEVPVEMAGVAAVIQNPWVGRGFVQISGLKSWPWHLY